MTAEFRDRFAELSSRSRIVPSLREWLRITGNALRYGIRSPKR